MTDGRKEDGEREREFYEKKKRKKNSKYNRKLTEIKNLH